MAQLCQIYVYRASTLITFFRPRPLAHKPAFPCLTDLAIWMPIPSKTILKVAHYRALPHPPSPNDAACNRRPQVAHLICMGKVSIFDEQYRVVAIEGDRLLIRGILSGDVLAIVNPEPETPLTHHEYPLGKLIALTDPSAAPLNDWN